jgi:uncharacterized membrane protein YbhN (UPF0104 family)
MSVMEDEVIVITSWTDYFKRSFRFWVIGCCLISLYISAGNIYSSFSEGYFSYGIGVFMGASLAGIILAAIIGSIFATLRTIIRKLIPKKVKKEE